MCSTRWISAFSLIWWLTLFPTGASEAATLQVNQDGTADYQTIQEAIDVSVQGDTIQVALGHYEEQLVLENRTDISIVGSGVGITWIDCPDTLSTSIDLLGYPQYPMVIVSQCEFLNFSNLTVDGRGQGAANMPFHGLGYFDSGGTLQDIHVTGIREEPLSYFYHGNGIFAVDFTGLGHNLDMENVLVDDFQKTGILLHGPLFKSIASNVRVVGQGPIEAPAQNGWQVSGLTELTATDCSAAELAYNSATFVATGMFGREGTKLNLTNCDFDACEVGVFGFGNNTIYNGGLITNPLSQGIVAKSNFSKSSMYGSDPQPIEISDNSATGPGSATMYLSGINLVGMDAGNSSGITLVSDNEIYLEMDNLDISHFAIGLLLYEGGGVIDGMAHNCNFSNNPNLGIFSNTAEAFDARYNDWSDPTGPFHPETNPLGLGDGVSDSVWYSPFLGGAALVITPADSLPVACGEPKLFTVSYVAGESTPDLFMYNVEIRAGEGLVRPVDPVSLNPWGGTELFLHYDTAGSSLTVTGSTIGGDPHPLPGPGTYDLFTVEISADADSGGTVFLENITLRDPDNVTIPAALSSNELIADCVPPAAVFAISASPHHNRIEVTWDHDGLDVDHYEVFSGLWHDGNHISVYPEYDDIIGNTVPARPADYLEITDNILAEWSLVGYAAGLNMDETWSDSSKRGVYYYEVFAVDAVGNSSPVAALTDRATNYWLGDVTDMDGFVDVHDVTALGASFGESDGDVYYNNFCDYGPTDTGGATGIPETDNAVGFEDLMIVAMNFGTVSDSSKEDKFISGSASLAWIEVSENLYALRLVEGEGIKGMHVAALQSGASVSISGGQLLEEQTAMTFLRNVGPALEASVAIMGAEIGFEGQGDLFMISSSSAITPEDLVIMVRGYDNSEVPFSLNALSGASLPQVFSLSANQPNPFNPETKIVFSLPEPRRVVLKVYGIDGRCVSTLVNEKRDAGDHEVFWNGRSDVGRAVASGTYFYRIEAGADVRVRKMTLVK